MSPLADRYGRRFPYLRLSVIPACNFRCTYCLPHGYHAEAKTPAPLSLAEITRLLRGFTELGMHKLRITGGEPSVRHDLTDILRTAAAVPGISKLAMTTNGSLLGKRLHEWMDAGLNAINVSVDTLDRASFARITGHDRLDDILHGVDMALAAGMSSVKLNAVLMRDVNDRELPAWLDYLRDRPIGVRFIELMQTGDNLAFFRDHHVRAETLEAQLLEAGWQVLPRAADAGPAREYRHAASASSRPTPRISAPAAIACALPPPATCACACSANSAYRCARYCSRTSSSKTWCASSAGRSAARSRGISCTKGAPASRPISHPPEVDRCTSATAPTFIWRTCAASA